MKTRGQRLRTIRRLIGRDKVSSQDELMKLLSDEGFQMTQATLSRDLKLLRVAKMPDNKKGYVYALPEQENGAKEVRKNQIPLTGFVSMSFAQGMGLIKTWSGFATSVASTIDSWNLWEIAGTIAGDDTILLIPRDGITKEDLIERLGELIPELSG
jgi:transcriptional regulator of arginine metabolism